MKKWMCAILALVLCAFVALAEDALPEPISSSVSVAAPESKQEAQPAPAPAAEAPKGSAKAAPQHSDDPSVAALHEAGEAHSEAKEVHSEAGAENPAGAASSTGAAENKAPNGAANAAKSEAANGADATKSEALDGAQGDAGTGEAPAPGAQQGEQGDAGTGEAPAPGTQQDTQGDAQAEGEAPSGEPGEDPSSPEAGSGDIATDPTAPEADPTDPDADAAALDADAAAPEAYMLVGAEKKTGTLAELLAEPGKKTVYLLVAKTEEILDFPLVNLKDVTLLPDPQAYPGENYAVKLMNGEVEITPEAIAAAVDERVMLLATVVELPPVKPEDPSAVRLTVTPLNYNSSAWMNWSPEFKLSGIPQDSQGYSYWAMIYDERFIPLAGDFYLPQEEGVYTLRFAIMDNQGDVVSKSDAYVVKLDLTPPELSLAVSESRDYTMTLSAIDAPGTAGVDASGVAEYSLDGGTTWMPLGEGERIVYTESQRKTFPPLSILVRDLAGNITGNLEEITLDRLPSTSGGGGGGGATAKPSVPHASGDGDAAPYASYELALPHGEVSELTLGGEPVDLHLDVDGSGPANFAAELTAWTADGDAFSAGEDSGAAEPARDTLVVRAQSNGTHSFVWQINGSVLRKLYNSDIRYLVLCADGSMLSLPTVGFTAGTKYAELKMNGVSTGEFVYEISMRTGSEPQGEAWNRSANCAVEIAVNVSGERYVMLDRRATPEMYSYDVYCGPEDLPDYPYGEYPGMED